VLESLAGTSSIVLFIMKKSNFINMKNLANVIKKHCGNLQHFLRKNYCINKCATMVMKHFTMVIYCHSIVIANVK
jgi:hypothetical protein